MKLTSTTPPGTRLLSPPARGAWIEIIGGREYKRLREVAPRTGGVD